MESFVLSRTARHALAIALFAAGTGCATQSTGEDTTAEASWREAIVANPTAEAGCFHASYPDMSWESIACTTAPSRPFIVGDGGDYAIEVAGRISESAGTFPHVSGLVSENDEGFPNTYSIQLNSNFMSSTAACEGGGAFCLSWAQFVYSSSEEAVFIQNWLIDFGDICPNELWIPFEGSCFQNSAAVTVPTLALSSDADLSSLKMSGRAVNNGNDTLVFANGTEAFITSEPDSITNLASDWNASEFNIFGDGGGTEAIFNKSTAMKVRVGVNDGTTATPTCVANEGTTGETNNRTLGACTATGGTEPAIEYEQSQ